jgi:IS4 transposase
MDEEWEVVASLLPPDWQQLARDEGAIRYRKGITDPAILLRLLLLHVAGGLSLRSTVARARELGWASLSDVALLKRLRTAGPWLRAMASRLYRATRFRTSGADIMTARRVRAIDATMVEEPGATGSSWRVHYSIRLPEMVCDFYDLTDVEGGETYKRFPIDRGDLVLADRGYCHREGVAHVCDAGGDVVVRLNSSGFPLEDRRGRRLDVLSRLRRLRGIAPTEWPVQFAVEKRTYQARLCALRKSQVAAERAKRKILQEAARKQKKVRPETLEYAEYVVVLATLPSDELDAPGVLGLYRARWQIELMFKRLKSLLQLGHLPKYDDRSARAWIEAKLLTVLLIERLLEEARFFSPWGYPLPSTKPLARIH